MFIISGRGPERVRFGTIDQATLITERSGMEKSLRKQANLFPLGDVILTPPEGPASVKSGTPALTQVTFDESD